MAHLVPSRYEHGLASYNAGKSIAYLIEVATEIDDKHDELDVAIGRASQTPDAKARQRIGDEREALRNGEYGADAMPSLIAGFLDGFLADFHKLVAPDTRPAGPR